MIGREMWRQALSHPFAEAAKSLRFYQGGFSLA